MMKTIWKKKLSVWTKKLSVGNAVIDTEHRNLIVMINGIESLINTRNSSALLQAFEQLEHWLCIHFANEANIAQSIDYMPLNNSQDAVVPPFEKGGQGGFKARQI